MAPTDIIFPGRNRRFNGGGVSCPLLLIGSGARQLWARYRSSTLIGFSLAVGRLLRNSPCHSVFDSAASVTSVTWRGRQCPPSNLVCAPLFTPGFPRWPHWPGMLAQHRVSEARGHSGGESMYLQDMPWSYGFDSPWARGQHATYMLLPKLNHRSFITPSNETMTSEIATLKS